MLAGIPLIDPMLNLFSTEISTFSASTPPLAEVLHLWDVMFAFGFHLNILFVLAQLVRRRTKILSSTRYIAICIVFKTCNRY